MVLIVKVLAITLIVYGCLLVLKSDTLKKILEYVKIGNRIYIANGIKAVIGILVFLAADYCSIPWVVRFFGALTVFTAIIGFLVKKSILLHMIEDLEAKSSKSYYIVGAVALVLGVLLALGA